MLGPASLLILCPSRMRPENIHRLIVDFGNTCTPGMTQLLIAVDDDDPAIDEYKRVEEITAEHDWVEFVYDERRRLGGTLNHLAPKYVDNHYAIGFMGDDHRPRTQGWDNYFLTALEQMEYGFVYGNDLFQGQNLPTQVAMTADVIDAMGYMVPPGCTHLYFDDMWLRLGQTLGKITYLPNVIVEHVHPLAGKGDMDELYKEVNSKSMYAHDKEIYDEWVMSELHKKARLIRSYCEGIRA